VYAGRLQHGHTVHGLLEDRLEVIEVFRKLVEAEVLTDAVHTPRLCLGLEGAEKHFAGILLVVGAFVWHSENRKACQILDRLGDDVEVFARVKRESDLRTRGKIPTPHPAAVDDEIGGDRALFAVLAPGHASHAAIPIMHRSHFDVLDDLGAALPSPLGQRHRNVGGITLPVEWQMDGTDDVRNVEVRIEVFDLLRRDFLDVDVERPGKRRLPVYLLLALRGERNGDRPVLAHAGRYARLFLELDIEVGRVFGQAGHVLRCAQLAN
jgi:hypothetical protein